MPFYIVNGQRVHLKFSGKLKKNPPAPCCARVERGGYAMRCFDVSTLLCDWPVGSGTCDAPLCAVHAHEVGPDRHYCPFHQRLDAAQKESGLF